MFSQAQRRRGRPRNDEVDPFSFAMRDIRERAERALEMVPAGRINEAEEERLREIIRLASQ